jgi:Probable zinc-ribbon domain
VAEERTCRECREFFTLDEDDVAFFEGKGFALPTRCRPCRARQRAEKARFTTATLTCRLCRFPFEFARGEQVFYARHRIAPPSLCQKCRTWRRDAKASHPAEKETR